MREHKLYVGRDADGLQVYLEMELRRHTRDARTTDLRPIAAYNVLSICGHAWERSRCNYAYGGQICDSIQTELNAGTFKPAIPEKDLRRILEIWRAWHLNDLNAGTTEQTRIVKAYFAETGERYDYTRACAVLSEQNMLVDRGYTYGYAWLVRRLPVEVAKEIGALFGVEITETPDTDALLIVAK